MDSDNPVFTTCLLGAQFLSRIPQEILHPVLGFCSCCFNNLYFLPNNIKSDFYSLECRLWSDYSDDKKKGKLFYYYLSLFQFTVLNV